MENTLYEFWSVNMVFTCYRCFRDRKCVNCMGSGRYWVWLCIPPSNDYLPENYPLGAIRKHKEELLPPPSYWLKPEYENIVYNNKNK